MDPLLAQEKTTTIPPTSLSDLTYENISGEDEITGIVDASSGRSKYIVGGRKNTTSIHWGQLKLLMSEIRFLTLYLEREHLNPQVVYAGASPGQHIPILLSLFPQVKFHLYDPRGFGIQGSDQIFLYNQYFTDEDAKDWSEIEEVYFISDIRTADFVRNKRLGHEGDFKTEADVWTDNIRQMKWVQIMRPVQALLKFRLPYVQQWRQAVHENSRFLRTYLSEGGVTATHASYLDGLLFEQPWKAPTSTEVRFVPNRDESGEYYTVNWDIAEYEEILTHHNQVTREKDFFNPFTNAKEPVYAPELLYDYDSILHAITIQEYLVKIQGLEGSLKEVQDYSDKVIGELLKALNLQQFTTANILSTIRDSELRDFKLLPQLRKPTKSTKLFGRLRSLLLSTSNRKKGQEVLRRVYKFLEKFLDNNGVQEAIRIIGKSKLDDAQILTALKDLRPIGGIVASCSREQSNVSDVSGEIDQILRSVGPDFVYLDLGCSEGHITAAIAGELQLEQARAHACDIIPQPPNNSFVFTQRDADKLPYEDGSFSLVTIFMSAHHFHNADATLDEIRRVTVPGAYILLREHDAKTDADSLFYDITHALYECVLNSEQTPEEFATQYSLGNYSHYRSEEEWTALMAKHGFKLQGSAHGPLTKGRHDADQFNSFYALYVRS